VTEKVGLLGWPLGYSLSPAMHNAAFQALGMDWHYKSIPVPPDLLPERVEALLQAGYRGFNVTIPHKAAVMALPQVCGVDPDARQIGAANTLTLLPNGCLHASNTDWRGFADDLAAHGIEVEDNSCLILGTGGSARAVRFALAYLGASRIWMVSRNPGGREDVVGYADLYRLVHDVCLVVNCTPVGMVGHTRESPWMEGAAFPPCLSVYDLVYNPPVTALMAQARAAGILAVGGLGMLVRQGALSFERWTGAAPPLDVMENAAREALTGRP
jgi:shikimate dehydrogenase